MILFSLALASSYARAGDTIVYKASLTATGASGKFAPYFLASNRHGKITQAWNGVAELNMHKALNVGSRFCYGYGVGVEAGYSSSVPYERFDVQSSTWHSVDRHPSRVMLGSLYGEVKYRSIEACVGMKETGSAMLCDRLSSGDLVHSANARPVPGLKVGFHDFQDVPLTNGWLQIDGELFYGRFADDGWWRKHYNYYNYHVADGVWLVYRRAYFRSKASKPLRVTVGVQCATQFGGSTTTYAGGLVQSVQHRGTSFRDFFKAYLPISNGSEDFRIGNTLGSWDMRADYALCGIDIGAYFQWPWEDGSGMAKRNGFDGLWGLELRLKSFKPVSGLVIEYLDMTNQSGPVHWAPDYVPGTTLTSPATGADDYYNNVLYNSYANYGMVMGTPMVMSPIYNVDGYPAVAFNRLRGIHLGIEGHITPQMEYRALFNHRKAWGSGYIPLLNPVSSTSVMVEAALRSIFGSGLNLKISLAGDCGKMPGDTFGTMVTLSYNGSLTQFRL